MNARERKVIDRLDDVLRVVGSLTPSNPADVRAISANLRIATSATKSLSLAIGALRTRDWANVEELLADAEEAVRW